MKQAPKYYFKLCLTLCFLAVLNGCRKDVQVNLPEQKQKVVIEGSIEAGAPAVVFLSYSVPYFSGFDYSNPEAVFIKGAVVTVSDGSRSEQLREFDPKTGYFYFGSTLIGQKGKTYTIRVSVDGQTFETSTSIGEAVGLDSLYFVHAHDSLGFVGQKFTEPAGSGNCYRWFAKRLNRGDQFYAAPFNSVFDDKFIDGKTFDFAYDRGTQPYRGQSVQETDNERGYFKLGDTIVVKFCTLGRREYEFWMSYYQNRVSNGNPFSSPSNIKSMFENHDDCIGAFVGYSPIFDTIVLK